MIFGIQLWGVLKDYHGDIFERLKELRRIGYAYIEPCISLEKIEGLEHVIWPAEWFRSNESAISETGMEIRSCHVFANDIQRQAEEAAELAVRSGIRQFVVKSPEVLTREMLCRTAEKYSSAGTVLGEAGAELLLHNELNDIKTKIDGKSAYEFLLKQCGGKVGAQVDVGWALAGGIDPVMLMNQNREYLRSVHIKDFNMNGAVPWEVLPGRGQLDINACVDFAKINDYPCIVDIDSFTDTVQDAAEILKEMICNAS